MKIIPYSEARPQIRVGDIIECRGDGWVGRMIRKYSAGEGDRSHVSTIIRDTTNEAIGRVEVLEAITDSRGMQRNPLSETYARDHGDLFWLRTNLTPEQRDRVMIIGAEIRDRKTKYDFGVTWRALFNPIFVDAKKFNCSESGWFLLTRCGAWGKRYDKKGREIAPTPSQFSAWAGIESVGLNMNA